MPSPHRLPLARRAEEPDSGPDGAAQAAEDEGEPRDLMQIGDLARETGRTVRTIHLYEELGLLIPAARSKGGFRLYDRDALLRIRWIGKLKDLGFSLGDIQTVAKEWEHLGSAPGAMKRMREVYARKLEETRAQRLHLQALEQEIEGSLRYLDTCEICDPQRLLSACNCCDLHDKTVDVPELVSGFRAIGSRGGGSSASCTSADSPSREPASPPPHLDPRSRAS